MSRFEISLSKDDLEHIANGYDIKIKINGKRFSETNEIILKPALTNDVMAPILNYRNDIIDHHQIQTEYTFIVKYDKDKGRWYGDGLSRTYRIDIAKRFLPHYYKVIGNIYENQELLEVENEN